MFWSIPPSRAVVSGPATAAPTGAVDSPNARSKPAFESAMFWSIPFVISALNAFAPST